MDTRGFAQLIPGFRARILLLYNARKDIKIYTVYPFRQILETATDINSSFLFKFFSEIWIIGQLHEDPKTLSLQMNLRLTNFRESAKDFAYRPVETRRATKAEGDKSRQMENRREYVASSR